MVESLHLSNKFVVVTGLILFGSLAHCSNHYMSRRKESRDIVFTDCVAYFLTAVFSGIVFGITAMLMSDNYLHFLLAVSTGSFLGLAGLTRITDVLIAVIKR